MKKLFILLFFWCGIVNASTYYVATDGDNGNSGTIGSPWLTIQHGIDALRAGDSLLVRGGTYIEQLTVYGYDGTASDPIVIMAYPDESPIIDATTIEMGAVTQLVRLLEDYIVFDEFELKNFNIDGILDAGDGIAIIGNYCTVANCVVHDIWNGGIINYSDYDTIEYCTVYDVCLENSTSPNLDGNSAGITCVNGSDHSVMRHNIVHDVWGEALSAWSTTYTTIEDNIVYDGWAVNLYLQNSSYCLVQRNFLYMTKVMTSGSQAGLLVSKETPTPLAFNNIIINNIVYGCRRNFFWADDQSNVFVAHNTFVNSTTYWCMQINDANYINCVFKDNIIVQDGVLPVIYINAAEAGITFSYNLWSKTPDADAVGSGDVISDPLFSGIGIYSDTSYYELQSESPAIGTGIAHDSVLYDYLDSTRVDPPTIGAIEYFDDVPAVDPTVITTTKPYYTSPTTATGGGNCTDDGGGTVSAKGVCWKTSANPTTSDSHTDEGAGAGTFESAITGINSTEIWHVRAYATNESGTSYGEDKTFRISYCTSGGKLIFDSNGKIVIYE